MQPSKGRPCRQGVSHLAHMLLCVRDRFAQSRCCSEARFAIGPVLQQSLSRAFSCLTGTSPKASPTTTPTPGSVHLLIRIEHGTATFIGTPKIAVTAQSPSTKTALTDPKPADGGGAAWREGLSYIPLASRFRPHLEAASHIREPYFAAGSFAAAIAAPAPAAAGTFAGACPAGAAAAGAAAPAPAGAAGLGLSGGMAGSCVDMICSMDSMADTISDAEGRSLGSWLQHCRARALRGEGEGQRAA